MVEPELSRRALTRLREIHACIAQRDPEAARRVVAEVHAACRLIGAQPPMGRAIEGTGLRFHVTRRYRDRVICQTGARVLIRDVPHPRQQWP